MDEYQKKLDALRVKYPGEDNHARFASWEKELKKHALFLNLQEHAAFKIIVDGYRAEVIKINRELMTNEALFKDEEGLLLGRLLHERRRFIIAFLKPFEAAKVGSVGILSNIEFQLA